MSLQMEYERAAQDLSQVSTLKWKIKSRTATQEEWTEWLSNLKGAYNTADLNRVGGAVQYIADMLTDCGYAVDVSPKTDWARADIPTPAQMETYRQNVIKVRAALSVFSTTPAVPGNMNKLTYQEANDIEKILVDVERLIDNMVASFIYSGEIYSGEDWT